MKAKILPILFSAALMATTASAANSSDFKKVSLQVHGGANVINNVWYKDGQAGWAKNLNCHGQAGAQFEYDFNPLWGLMLDYTWINNNQVNYDNQVHTLGAMMSINMTNLLAKYRLGIGQKINVYLNAGIGEGYTIWKNATTAKGVKIEDDNKLTHPFFVMGVNAEYNISRMLSVGFGGEGRYFMGQPTETGEGSYCFHPTTNGGQGMYMLNLALRYKFGGEKNIRNVYYGEKADLEPMVMAAEKRLDEQDMQFNAYKQRTDNDIEELKAQNEALMQSLMATKTELDSIKSGAYAEQQRQQKMADSLASVKKDLDELEAIRNINKKFNPTGKDTKVFAHFSANLQFETGTAIIKKVSYPALNDLADLIKRNANTVVFLTGYTDNVGDPDKNKELSKDRAEAVKTYLVKKGINAKRIAAEGRGQESPIADNNTKAGRAKNRRVEIALYQK